MKRQVVRVEPLSLLRQVESTNVSSHPKWRDHLRLGVPPFDPATENILTVSIERQAEVVLDQMKLSLNTAGSSFGAIQKQPGFVPNLHRLVSTSPVVLARFGSPQSTLSKALDTQARYAIALAVSEATKGGVATIDAHRYAAAKLRRSRQKRSR